MAGHSIYEDEENDAALLVPQQVGMPSKPKAARVLEFGNEVGGAYAGGAVAKKYPRCWRTCTAMNKPRVCFTMHVTLACPAFLVFEGVHATLCSSPSCSSCSYPFAGEGADRPGVGRPRTRRYVPFLSLSTPHRLIGLNLSDFFY